LLDDQRITYVKRKGELFKKFRESFSVSFDQQINSFKPKVFTKEKEGLKTEIVEQSQNAVLAIQASIMREVQLLGKEKPQ